MQNHGTQNSWRFALVVLMGATLSLTGSCQPEPARYAATGRVLSGWSGRPLNRAIIYHVGTLDQAVTEPDGTFTLDLPPGEIELAVQALGYAEKRVTVSEDHGPIEVTLDPVLSPEFLEAIESQQDDAEFTVTLDAPTHPPDGGPTVYIDEGHHNFHTATGRYRVFAELLRADGYRVERSRSAFTEESLAPMELLVSATPFNGIDEGDLPAKSAFKVPEIEALIDWISGGGSLLLIADHMPTAGSVQELLTALGISLENGYAVDTEGGQRLPSPLVFRRDEGLLLDHPITRGRVAEEGIDSVATFTGFAFQASAPFEPLLVLPDDAVSINTRRWGVFEDDTPTVPVGGWLQGTAAEYGRGRVVIMGEAAMFTAQVRGSTRWRNGLSDPEAGQNAQFLLNIVHWLEGRLD